MSEKIFCIIMLMLVLFVVFFLVRLLRDRRTIDRIGKSIDRATTENNSATKSIEEAKGTVDGIGEELEELSELSGRSKEIINRIKGQRIDK